MNKTYRIDLGSDGIIPIKKKQTILEASLDNKIMHFNACGGKAKCTTCKVLIIDGADLLSKPNGVEADLARRENFPTNVRLACQTKVLGEIVRIKRIILDEFDRTLYLKKYCKSMSSSVGEERQMVMFFFDIRDFTNFIETHMTFDVVHIIRRLSTVFREIIQRNGGKIIEAAGDGFYAVFNWNNSIEKAAQDAVKGALEIIEYMKQFNENYLKNYFNTELQIGIGIHLGKVIIGSMGFGGEDTLAVMGPSVNIASRLQESTKYLNNNLIISENVFKYLSLKNHISAKNIDLKGLSRPIKVRLLGSENF